MSYTLTQLIPLPHSLPYLSLHLCSPTLSPHSLYPTLFPHSLSCPPISPTISPTLSPLPPLSPLICFLPCLHSLVLPSLSSLSPPLSHPPLSSLSFLTHYQPFPLSSLSPHHSPLSLHYPPLSSTILSLHSPHFLHFSLFPLSTLFPFSLHSLHSFLPLPTHTLNLTLSLHLLSFHSLLFPHLPHSFSIPFPSLYLSPSVSFFSPHSPFLSLYLHSLPTSSLLTPLYIPSFPPHPPPSLYLYYISYTLPFPNSFLCTPLTLPPLYLLSQPISLTLLHLSFPHFPSSLSQPSFLSLHPLTSLLSSTLSLLLLPYTFISPSPSPFFLSYISPPNSLLLLPLLPLSPFPHSPHSLSLSHPCSFPHFLSPNPSLPSLPLHSPPYSHSPTLAPTLSFPFAESLHSPTFSPPHSLLTLTNCISPLLFIPLPLFSSHNTLILSFCVSLPFPSPKLSIPITLYLSSLYLFPFFLPHSIYIHFPLSNHPLFSSPHSPLLSLSLSLSVPSLPLSLPD